MRVIILHLNNPASSSVGYFTRGSIFPGSVSVPRDSESSLNALLSQLGPADIRGEGEIEESSSREAMVGGLVNCLLIPAHRDTGRQELRGGAIQGASLQRIASRCQCSVIYVSYGSQVEPEGCDPALLTVSPL